MRHPGSITVRRGDESWVLKVIPVTDFGNFTAQLLAWIDQVFPKLDEAGRRELILQMGEAVQQTDVRGRSLNHVTVTLPEPGKEGPSDG